MLNYESKNTSSVLGVKRANDVLYFVTLDVFVRIRIDTVPKFRNGFFCSWNKCSRKYMLPVSQLFKPGCKMPEEGWFIYHFKSLGRILLFNNIIKHINHIINMALRIGSSWNCQPY